MEGVIHTLQALLIVGPVIAYFVTKRICIALQKKDREIALHGYESGRIVRLPGGEYIEVHQPVDEYERWKLVDIDSYEPLSCAPTRRAASPVREHPCRTVALALRGSPRSAHADRDRRGRAHQHHELEHIATEEDPELQGAHERAGVPDAPRIADRRWSQLRDRRPSVERDRRGGRLEEGPQSREGARLVSRVIHTTPRRATSRCACRGVSAVARSHTGSRRVRRALTAPRRRCGIRSPA